MANLTYSDDLELIVTGANIAGYLEHNECIYVPSDTELTDFLLDRLRTYYSDPHGYDDICWAEYIMDELTNRYGHNNIERRDNL